MTAFSADIESHVARMVPAIAAECSKRAGRIPSTDTGPGGPESPLNRMRSSRFFRQAEELMLDKWLATAQDVGIP